MSNDIIDLVPNTTRSGEFAIGADDRGILRHSLADNYTRKKIAPIFEILTNCGDAQALAGVDTPIQVTMSPEGRIEIRDHGIGMSAEFLTTSYTQFNVSGWRDDDRANGAYGIGAKAPLAVTDNYEVVSTHGGRTAHLIVRATPTNITWTLLSDKETPGVPNGTTVSFDTGDLYGSYSHHRIHGLRRVLVRLAAVNPDMSLTLNGNVIDGGTTVLATYDDLGATVVHVNNPREVLTSHNNPLPIFSKQEHYESVQADTILRMRRNTYLVETKAVTNYTLSPVCNFYSDNRRCYNNIVVVVDRDPGYMTTTNTREDIQSDDRNAGKIGDLKKVTKQALSRYLSSLYTPGDDMQTAIDAMRRADVAYATMISYTDPVFGTITERLYNRNGGDEIREFSANDGAYKPSSSISVEQYRDTTVVYGVPNTSTTTISHMNRWANSESGPVKYNGRAIVLTTKAAGEVVAWHTLGGKDTVPWETVREVSLAERAKNGPVASKRTKVSDTVRTNYGQLTKDEILALGLPRLKVSASKDFVSSPTPWVEFSANKATMAATGLDMVKYTEYDGTPAQLIDLANIHPSLMRMIDLRRLVSAERTHNQVIERLIDMADRWKDVKDPTLRKFMNSAHKNRLRGFIDAVRVATSKNTGWWYSLGDSFVDPEMYTWRTPSTYTTSGYATYEEPLVNTVVLNQLYPLISIGTNGVSDDQIIEYINMAYKSNCKSDDVPRIVETETETEKED